MTALLLLPTTAPSATAWVRRGVVACHVGEDGPWTLVLAADGRTAAQEPYDDPTAVLLSRPVGPRLAPALGVGVVGDRAVVVAQPSGWRAVRRWALRPRLGPVVRDDRLPPLRPGDLAPFAEGRVGEGRVAETLEERGLTAHEWLAHVLDALGLPGGEVVRGESVPGPVVEPDPRSVTAFARVVEESRP